MTRRNGSFYSWICLHRHVYR